MQALLAKTVWPSLGVGFYRCVRALSFIALAVCLAPAREILAAAEQPSAAVAPPGSKIAADYIIGPGDSLQVFVWRNPELTVIVPVRPDGRISTPLVEDMVAVGKAPSVLARDIEKVLEEYIRSPQVNIIVTQSVSAYSQVKVIGQVVTPRAVGFREGMTVLDAILEVGGLAPFAAGNRSKLVRREDGKDRERRIKLDDLLNRGDMRQNYALQAGDVIVVPQSRL